MLQSLRCHDATLTDHQVWAGKAGPLSERREGGRQGPHGHVHSACWSDSKEPDTRRCPRTEPRPVRALPGPLRCRPHRRAPFADVTPSTERCRHFQRKSIPPTTFRGPLCFEFHPTPRSVRATGQTKALVVANAFIIMGPVLAEPLISPVDLHRLQATALGFI